MLKSTIENVNLNGYRPISCEDGQQRYKHTPALELDGCNVIPGGSWHGDKRSTCLGTEECSCTCSSLPSFCPTSSKWIPGLKLGGKVWWQRMKLCRGLGWYLSMKVFPRLASNVGLISNVLCLGAFYLLIQ